MDDTILRLSVGQQSAGIGTGLVASAFDIDLGAAPSQLMAVNLNSDQSPDLVVLSDVSREMISLIGHYGSFRFSGVKKLTNENVIGPVLDTNNNPTTIAIRLFYPELDFHMDNTGVSLDQSTRLANVSIYKTQGFAQILRSTGFAKETYLRPYTLAWTFAGDIRLTRVPTE